MNIIPHRYHFNHKFCRLMLSFFAQTISQGEAEELFSENLQFRGEDNISLIEGKSGEELITCLIENGYEKTINSAYYKQTTIALIADFCQFLYAALENSQKGILSVAYSLLRKPFTENLFFLEWMLARPSDFLEWYKQDNDVRGRINNIRSSDGLTIIREAMKKCVNGQWIEPEFIYKVRFDKNFDIGLERVWQKAIHLITSHKAIKTESNNLNFIFSDEQSEDSQWYGLYSVLPLLLMHTYEIIEQFIREFSGRHLTLTDDITALKLTAGLILCGEECYSTEMQMKALKAFERKLLEMSLSCQVCKTNIKYKKKILKNFHLKGFISCCKCGFKNRFSKPNFDNVFLKIPE